jgi:hypothetical protein
MSKRIGLTAIAVCLFCVAGLNTSSEVQARGVRWSVSVGNSYYGGHGRMSHGYYPRHHRSPYHRAYHYRGRYGGHYDYHAPSAIWHGNHIDVMPGHYDYHRGGHWRY